MTQLLLDFPEWNRPKFIQYREVERVPLPSERFTDQQTSMMQAMVSGKTPTEAAEQTGLRRHEVYREMEKPHVRLAIENTQREYYSAIAIRFHTLADKALNALEQILDNPNASPTARIKAATIIFARMERGQPAIPATSAQMDLVSQQCSDQNAPHLVVGRKPEGVTDRDANQLPPRAVTPESVTDRDANSIQTPASMSATEPNETDRDAKSVRSLNKPATSASHVTDRDELFDLSALGEHCLMS